MSGSLAEPNLDEKEILALFKIIHLTAFSNDDIWAIAVRSISNAAHLLQLFSHKSLQILQFLGQCTKREKRIHFMTGTLIKSVVQVLLLMKASMNTKKLVQSSPSWLDMQMASRTTNIAK